MHNLAIMMVKGAPSKRRQACLGGLACLLLVSIGWPVSGAAQGLADPPVLDDSETPQQALQDLLLGRAAAAAQSPLQTQILAFYNARDFTPIWSGKGTAEIMAQSVVTQLQNADEQGLNPNDYVSNLLLGQVPEGGPAVASYDLALTDALFRYASDLALGRVSPAAAYKDVRLPDHELDIAALLSSALARGDLASFFATLPPPHPEYHELAAALARYRAVIALGGWPMVPVKDGIALDAKDPMGKLLIRRLAFEDPLLASNRRPSPTDVEMALVRYQIRNGLQADGKAERETLASLNIPPAARMRQIVVNMERWRWLPDRFERRYIRVNVPDQSMDMIENGAVALHSRVVIGTKKTPTPILRTDIVAVVANPPWDLPDDIAARDLLPHLRKDSEYLATRKFTLVDGPASDPDGAGINWRKVKPNQLPYQIEQPPGPNNVLGRYMLDSPNDFDVYMHDTPKKELFTLSDREASNGCVRVEEIAALARLVLHQDGQDEEKLDAATASPETQSLALSHPLPVYMVYWTAIAGADGTVGFRPDLYHRDAVLLAKMGTSISAKSAPLAKPQVAKPQAVKRSLPHAKVQTVKSKAKPARTGTQAL